MKVGDLVQVKHIFRHELTPPWTGIVLALSEKGNGKYVKVHTRPYAAHAGYFEVISESR